MASGTRESLRTLGASTPSHRGIHLRRAIPSIAIALALVAPLLGASPTAASASGTFIDTNNRAEVEAAFHILADTAAASGWNGDINSCNAGTTSQSYRNATLEQLNVHRALAGVSPLVEDATLTSKAQQAALIVAANGVLDHTPSPSANCYSAAGYEGSSNSNLGIGFAGPEGPSIYANDSNVTGVGHRRTILYPNAVVAGLGAILGTTWDTRSDALWVETNNVSARPMRSTERLVAWPTEGYFVNTMSSSQWSLVSDGDIDLTNASVSATLNGSTIPVEIVSSNPNTVVWKPALTSIDASKDQVVQTTINHSSGNKVLTTILIPMPEEYHLNDGNPDWNNAKFIHNAETMHEIVNSVDYDTNKHPAILRLYRAYFDREPDVGGAQYWLEVSNSRTITQIANYFSGSDEFAANYNGVSNEVYLTRVYANILGRKYDQGGFDYWIDILKGTNCSGKNPEYKSADKSTVVLFVGTSTEFTGRFPYLPSVENGAESFYSPSGTGAQSACSTG